MGANPGHPELPIEQKSRIASPPTRRRLEWLRSKLPGFLRTDRPHASQAHGENLPTVESTESTPEYRQAYREFEVLRDQSLTMTERGKALMNTTHELEIASPTERTITKDEEAQIAERARDIAEYNRKYKPAIADLLAQVREREEAHSGYNDIEGYLGGGRNGYAYKVTLDGQELAVKVLLGGKETMHDIDIQPLLAARGVPHTQELVSYSYADGIEITKLIPGKTVLSLGKEVKSTGVPLVPSEQQILDLVDAVVAVSERGIVIDPNQDNYMYDPTEGFTLLDLNPSNGEQDKGRVMGYIGGLLNACLDITPNTAQGIEKNISSLKAKLQASVTLLQLLKQHRPALYEAFAKRCLENENPPVEVKGKFTGLTPIARDFEGGLSDPGNQVLCAEYNALIGNKQD